MAEKEDIKRRLQKINPRLSALSREIDRALISSGYTGAIVETTEDMTEEEELMALFEGYLREGYPEDIAEKKAKEIFEKMKIFISKRQR